jgi:hypothetical protein
MSDPMDALEHTHDPRPPETQDGDLADAVFAVFGDRLEQRAADIARFTETNCNYRHWCIWELVAAVHEREPGWSVQPAPPYADAGVTGSREHADLSVFDPRTGERVLIELTVIHDWSRNKWIDELDGDTARLSRPLTAGIMPLQLVVTASLASPIEVNPRWQQWLAMSSVWGRPTSLYREMTLGTVGQLGLHGWVLTPGG